MNEANNTAPSKSPPLGTAETNESETENESSPSQDFHQNPHLELHNIENTTAPSQIRIRSSPNKPNNHSAKAATLTGSYVQLINRRFRRLHFLKLTQHEHNLSPSKVSNNPYNCNRQVLKMIPKYPRVETTTGQLLNMANHTLLPNDLLPRQNCADIDETDGWIDLGKVVRSWDKHGLLTKVKSGLRHVGFALSLILLTALRCNGARRDAAGYRADTTGPRFAHYTGPHPVGFITSRVSNA
ncbi:hypothetical protein CBL_08722 [Carabus blaptoides fortunei]